MKRLEAESDKKELKIKELKKKYKMFKIYRIIKRK